MADHQPESDRRQFSSRPSRRAFLQALGVATIGTLASASETHARAGALRTTDLAAQVAALLHTDPTAQQAFASFGRQGFRFDLARLSLVAHPHLAQIFGVRIDASEHNRQQQVGLLACTVDLATKTVRHVEQAIVTADQTGTQAWAGVVELTAIAAAGAARPVALLAHLSRSTPRSATIFSEAEQAIGKREEYRYAIGSITTAFRADTFALTQATFAQQRQWSQPRSLAAWQPTGFVHSFERGRG